MSLIHNALKSVESDASSSAGPVVRRLELKSAKADGGWLGGVLAFAVVVAAGAAGWWLWSGAQIAARPAAMPPPSVLVVAVPGPVTPPALAQPAIAAVVAPPPEPAVQTASAAATSPSPTTATPFVSKNKQKVISSTGNNKKQAIEKEASVGAKAIAPAADITPVELRFARFVTAMKTNDVAAAETELRALRVRLPAGSLGLVRVQAWFDLKTGSHNAAVAGYQSILERLPGDEEAAVNLASLHSQRQQTEAARQVLARALQVNPDSVPLRTALNQFTPAVRP